jgi:hypothetical protein
MDSVSLSKEETVYSLHWMVNKRNRSKRSQNESDILCLYIRIGINEQINIPYHSAASRIVTRIQHLFRRCLLPQDTQIQKGRVVLMQLRIIFNITHERKTLKNFSNWMLGV